MTEQVVNLLTLTAQSTVDTVTADLDTLPGPNTHEANERKTRITLDVTAISGTSPTLDVSLVAIIDGVEVILHAFTQATAIGQQTVTVDVVPRVVRVRYVVGGTGPSVTGTVSSLRI